MRKKTVTPKDQMSTDDPYGFLRMISGAANGIVPKGSLLRSFGPMILERPKSMILTCDRSEVSTIIMLSGFRSRCAIPNDLRYQRAVAIWWAIC